MNSVSRQRIQVLLKPIARWSTWPGAYPVALLLIGLLTYLYALPWLGWFWDDWEVVFLLNARDPQLLAGYFAFDRPFAWPYQLMYTIFGANPIAWHSVTLLARWGGVVLLYLALVEIWPRQRTWLQWAGALTLLYPGYLQQSISGAYNRHFAAFLVFALSMYLMVWALRSPRIKWLPLILSWIAAFIQVFTIEYFVGLELARVLLIWLLLSRNGETPNGARLRKTLQLSVPYLLTLGFYLWWRLVIFPATISLANYAGDFKLLQDFEGSIISGILGILTRAFVDLLYGVLQVWLSALGEAGAWTFEGKISWFAFGLAALLSSTFAYINASPADKGRSGDRPPRSFFWFALAAFLTAALPVWLTSKQLSTQGRWDDRFALAPMWGAVLLSVWLIGNFIRSRQQRLVLALLLGLSIVTQILFVNRYRLDWAAQNDYYWQLSWRVPALEPGTAVVSFEQPSASIPGYDASFAINLLFGRAPDDGNVPYWFFTNDRFMNFDLKPGKTITYKDRNLRFRGNTSDAIAIIHQGEKRCLQVLDEVYAAQPFYGAGQEQLVAVSNVLRISSQQVAAPSPQYFGPEPQRSWCYYFQKADLARQNGDWEGIRELELQARSEGYSAAFGPELLPFIEAHARLNEWSEALALSQAANATVSEMGPLLCSTWNRLGRISNADTAVTGAALEAFACAVP